MDRMGGLISMALKVRLMVCRLLLRRNAKGRLLILGGGWEKYLKKVLQTYLETSGGSFLAKFLCLGH